MAGSRPTKAGARPPHPDRDADGDAASSGGPLGPPGLGRLFAFGVLFAALTAAGLLGIARPGATSEAVRIAPPELVGRLSSGPALALLGTLLAVYFAADGLRLYFALAALGHRLPGRTIAKLVFVNFVVSNLTPLATGGGFAQVWFLSRRGVPIGAATAATSVRTLMAAGMIFMAAPLALLRLERSSIPLPAGPLLAFVSVAAFAIGVGIVGVLRRPRWLLRAGTAAIDRAHGAGVLGPDRHAAWRRRLQRETIHFARSVAAYAAGGRRELALATLATAVFLVSLFSFPPAILWALGSRPQLLDWYGLMTLTTAAMYAAPTPGAAGIAEGVFGLLVSGGVPPTSLPFLTLVWRALTIHLGVLIGVLVLADEVGGLRARRRPTSSTPPNRLSSRETLSPAPDPALAQDRRD